MRLKLFVCVLCAAFTAGLTVRANEKPTEAYQKAMKDLGAATNSLRVNIRALDYAAMEKDAATYRAAFATVLEFWTSRKVDDAINLAQQGVKGAEELETAAKAKSLPGIVAAQSLISGSPSTGAIGAIGVCAPCHLAHRVRLPDGTFEIK